MAKLLLVDDDPSITTSLVEGLTALGYIVDVAQDTAFAREMLAVSQYDLMILDWQMPGKSGVEFLSELRQEGTRFPVLMLTGRGATADKIVGLDNGADDYLTKPFSLGELVSRLRALLRRPQSWSGDELQSGDIVVNTKSRIVTRAGVELQLTRQEYLLLEFFLRNKNKVFNAEALVERAWSGLSESSPDTVRVHLANLRRKLNVKGEQCPIHTIHRQGYILRE